MALEVKKARFNPFVLPSDFFKSDGDPVYREGVSNGRRHNTRAGRNSAGGEPSKFECLLKVESDLATVDCSQYY